jgi:hypothetical protein
MRLCSVFVRQIVPQGPASTPLDILERVRSNIPVAGITPDDTLFQALLDKATQAADQPA